MSFTCKSYALFFSICLICIDGSIAQSGADGHNRISVKLSEEKGETACLNEIKTFDELFIPGVNDSGFIISKNDVRAKTNQHLFEVSVNSGVDGASVIASMIVVPSKSGCGLYGQRIGFARLSCNQVMANEGFAGISSTMNDSGVHVLLDRDKKNQGFMVGNDVSCARVEVASMSSNSGLDALSKSSDGVCDARLTSFKSNVVNQGLEYPLATKSNKVKSGIITQRRMEGGEIIFYVATESQNGKCDLAVNQSRLLPIACEKVREGNKELRDLGVKAVSKSGGVLLGTKGSIEMQMNDISDNSCLISVHQIFWD